MALPAPDRRHLAALEPKITLLSPATLVWRVYRSAGEHPSRWDELRHFGPLPSRFDHHLDDEPARPRRQERGILYAAPDLLTGLAEAFQAGRFLDRHDRGPRVVAFHLRRPIRLLDLTGRFTTRAGCHQGIHSSPLRPRTRQWARAFYETWPEIQGLLVRSKMAVDLPAFVFFERMADALPAAPLVDLPLTAASLAPTLAAIARELGYGIS